jgi:hypothetical protein
MSQKKSKCDRLLLMVSDDKSESSTSQSAPTRKRAPYVGILPKGVSAMNLATTNTTEKIVEPVATDSTIPRASRVLPKSERITFRLTFRDRQALENLVAGSNKTLSDWIRETTLNSIQKQKTSLSA